MKNREKYAEEIKNYNGTNFCKDFIKPIIYKKENCCSIGCERCAMLTALWLDEEYTESEIDWSKVYIWYGGRTSWSSDDRIVDWRYAKLAEQEESDE